MIENLEQMEMRAGESRLVGSACSLDVKSSIAGVVGSPNQLRLTPSPGIGFHCRHKAGEPARENHQHIEIKG
jgi:hypothetical protein